MVIKAVFVLSFGMAVGFGFDAIGETIPNFQGKFAAVHEQIWKFSHEKDAKEKLRLASMLQIGSIVRTEDAGLSQAEMKIEKEAVQLLSDTEKRGDILESGLTPKDIASITSANPDSLYRRTKSYSTHFRDKCSLRQYAEMRDKLGFTGIKTRASRVGPLVTVYEDEYRKSYLQKLIALLKHDARFGRDIDLADSYYALMLESFANASSAITTSRRARYEKELATAGVPVAQVRDFTLDLSTQYSDCLGGISVEFVHAMQDDETKTRGLFLIDKLRAFVQKNGKAPSDLDDLPLDKTDPIFGKSYDAWGNPYVLSKLGNLLVISSSGRDGKSQIKIGATSAKP